MKTIDIIIVALLVTFWSFHCGVIGYAFGYQAAYEEKTHEKVAKQDD